jgi:hypothetical protein
MSPTTCPRCCHCPKCQAIFVLLDPLPPPCPSAFAYIPLVIAIAHGDFTCLWLLPTVHLLASPLLLLLPMMPLLTSPSSSPLSTATSLACGCCPRQLCLPPPHRCHCPRHLCLPPTLPCPCCCHYQQMAVIVLFATDPPRSTVAPPSPLPHSSLAGTAPPHDMVQSGRAISTLIVRGMMMWHILPPNPNGGNSNKGEATSSSLDVVRPPRSLGGTSHPNTAACPSAHCKGGSRCTFCCLHL